MTEVRAAAYLATLQRLDRKKVRGVIKCKPPNVQCGKRCIPPSWDCRLKGEGADPHLKAVKTDPLKGLASIERGTKRIIKGVSKGSFSDIQGGRKAIIRGTVTIAPGDLQQKQKLQRKLEDRTRTIGVGLAVVATGLGTHALLMRTNPRNYRTEVGIKIETATREGVNKVLDAMPLLGAQRAQNRNVAAQIVGEASFRAREQQLRGPAALTQNVGSGGESALKTVSLSSRLKNSAGDLDTELTKVNEKFKASNDPDILKLRKTEKDLESEITNITQDLKQRKKGRDADAQAHRERTASMRSEITRAKIDKNKTLQTELIEQRREYYNRYTANKESKLQEEETLKLRLSDLKANLKEAKTAIREASVGVSFSPDGGFTSWNKVHRNAFWNVKESQLIEGRKSNIFARPTAENYLAKQYNLTNDEVTSDLSIKTAIASRLQESKLDLTRLAKQQGYRVTRVNGIDVINKDDIGKFVDKLTASSFGTSSTAQSLRSTVNNHLVSTLTSSPEAHANKIYKETVKGFDSYFSRVGETTSNITQITAINSKKRELGYSEIIQSADRARANYLAGSMGLSRGVVGDAHAELINRAYFHTRVIGNASSTYNLSDRLARSAASELTGRPVTSTSEAFRLLTTQHGFPGAKPTNTPVAPRAPRSLKRQMALGQLARQIMSRAGNEGMSLEAALRAAKSEIDQRGDSLAVVRAAAYLAMRHDLRNKPGNGKPCGESHIPKTYECRKGKGTTSPVAPIQAETTKSNPKKILIAALGAVAAVGATAIAVDAARYFSNKHLPHTGDYRSVLKAQLKKDGLTVKDSQKAISNYYDEAAKDWRLGEVVYYKRGKEIDGHFGIYLGKRDGKHQFAGVGAATSEMGSKVPSANVGISEYGPNSKYDSKPVIWQKAPDKIQPPRGTYSDTEIIKRATLMLGKPYKLDMLNNNCESWASMIVSGVPYSTQTKRFTVVTQGLIAARDKIVNRNAQGLTAEQMSTWLAFNHRRFVKDNEDVKYPTLVDPKEVLKPSMSELEAMLTVKQYLMTLLTPIKSESRGDAFSIIRTATYLAVRNDLRNGRSKTTSKKGKPCGKSFIPKNHKCLNESTKTAAKVALVAGATAATVYGLKKAKLGEFHTGAMLGDMNAPYRRRRFSFMTKNQAVTNTTDLVTAYTSLRKAPGVIPENVDTFNKFIAKNKVVNDPKNFFNDFEAGLNLEKNLTSSFKTQTVSNLKKFVNFGLFGGLATGYSNNVYVASTRKSITKLNIDGADVAKSVNSFMDRRAATENVEPSATESFRQLFTIGRNTKNGDTAEALNTIHEIAHLAHYKAGRNAGISLFEMSSGRMYQPSVIDKKTGKSVSSTDLQKALRKVTSEYGRSDVDGTRSETFAELSVLYVAQGKRFQREHPIAYDWVDQIWRQAQ